MNAETTTETRLKKLDIRRIEQQLAIELYHSMKSALPETSVLTDVSLEKQSLHDRIYFAARHENNFVGVISIASTNLHNIHIEFLVVNHPDLLQTVGTRLLLAVENFCHENGYSSLTVETLFSKQNDLTEDPIFYYLYSKAGYKPLIEISLDTNQIKLLLQKILGLNDFTFIDLTHSLSADVPHWGVDVGFKYNARYIQTPESARQVRFRVQRLEMSAGIGTHLDAPSHCFENGQAVAAIPLQSLISPCRVIDVSAKAHETYSVTEEDIALFEEEFGTIPRGAFVIIYTGWDQRWNQPEKYRNEKIFPNVSVEAARLLLSRGITGLGIDTLSPDAFGSSFPVHELILGAGKYIIENVANANQLDPADGYVFALPMKISDGTEAPMRLIGMKRKRTLA